MAVINEWLGTVSVWTLLEEREKGLAPGYRILSIFVWANWKKFTCKHDQKLFT